jgi:chemotaxis methyl-accepting protein methylase
MFHSIPEKAIEKTKICMLSSSLNPEEKTAAMSYKNVLRYFEKPLKKEALIELTVALQAER